MIKVQVLKESEKYNLQENSIVFLEDEKALKAIEAGVCKVYCDCVEIQEEVKFKKKSKE
jgi:hypothetical protein